MIELLHFSGRLNQAGVKTFVTTRVGGVSKGPFESLNLSYSTGDDKAAVAENRKRVAEELGIEPTHLISARQEHGVHIWEVSTKDVTPQHADILLTSEPGVALMVLSADCVPIVLFDPKLKILGAVHAGRRGVAAGAAREAIKGMTERFKCSPKDIHVGIGPAISQKNYEIDAPLIAEVQAAFPNTSDQQRLLAPSRPGHARLDLVWANILQLVEAGVPKNQIEVLNLDTFSSTEQFYSARRQKPFGCFGTGILLSN